MPSLGPAEILVVFVVALLVFGPDKMPEIARQVGRGMREFRRVKHQLSEEFRDVVSDLDIRNALSGEGHAADEEATAAPEELAEPVGRNPTTEADDRSPVPPADPT